MSISSPEIERMGVEDLAAFDAVVTHGSFTAAARELGIPRPTLSRWVTRLETRLGLKLLHRSTRRLEVTAAGREAVEPVREALAALQRVRQVADLMTGAPRGLLRIAAPPVMGPLVCGELISDLLIEFEALAIQMDLDDRRVDLVGEGYDIGLRMAPVGDEALVAWPMGVVHHWVVGPQSLPFQAPVELDHQLLTFGGQQAQLSDGEQTTTVRASKRLKTTDYGVLWRAAARGLGPALLPHPMCRPGALQAAGLQRIMPGWRSTQAPVFMVRPAERAMPPKSQVFWDRLKEAAAAPCWPLSAAD